MARTDARIDAYIDKAEDFAKPILNHLRALVHQARPDVEEAVKWNMPFFTLGGKNLANMAAFKEHAAFGFWERLGVDTPKANQAMGHFGRIRSLEDLPDKDELVAMILSVAEKMQGQRAAPKKSKPKPVKVPPLPAAFAKAIAANPDAQKTYDEFSPGYRRDYILWVTGAKREQTRDKRMATAVEWMAEGKDLNWKYR
ncbi:YdeI/OmpD-associated family protein [Roseovarius sp.]|uniref:YdeI/OmpD-associated family protein n=1 Tax=Roseovarius sp. TaxID=1486281 RepID=UPI003A9722E0